MEDEEVCVKDEGAPEVARRHQISFLFRRPRLEGFERHRVVTWLNCSGCLRSRREEPVNVLLKAFFLILLAAAGLKILTEQSLINTFGPRDEPRPLWRFQLEFEGIVLVIVSVAVVVGLLVRKLTENVGSTPRTREEVKTISGLVQQV